KAMAAAVRKWLAGEVTRVEKTVEERPAAALLEMTRLDRRAKGLPEENNLAKILQSIAATKQRGPQSGRFSPAAEAKRFKLLLSAITADEKASEALKHEAKDAIAGLP